MLLLFSVAAIGLRAPMVAAADDPKLRQARGHFDRGEAAFASQRFEDALREFQAGYQLVPRPGFILNIAHTYKRMGNFRKARASYRQYLLLDPESPRRAEVERTLTDIEVALEEDAERSARRADPPADRSPAVNLNPPPSPRETGSDSAVTLNEQLPPPSPSPSQRPFYKRVWFWGVVGGVVAGGVVAAVLLSRPSDAPFHSAGTLGTLGEPAR